VGQLLVHQLLTRCATFALNIAVARQIGPVAYGISAVQFYLLNTVILFAAREAVRRATLRYAAPPSLRGRAAAVYERCVLFNLSWLAIVLAIPLCIVVRALFLASAPSFDESDVATNALSSSTLLSAQYARCITLYTLASFIELLSEPLYVLFQKQQRVSARVMIDGAAVMVRCVVTFVSLLLAQQADESSVGDGATGKGGRLLAFAHGQLAFAACIVVGYYALFMLDVFRAGRRKASSVAEEAPVVTSVLDLLPRRLPTLPTGTSAATEGGLLSSFLDPPLFRLTREVLVQSLEKLLLLEGE
jgi:oligosaccharide translocation protein RFT1